MHNRTKTKPHCTLYHKLIDNNKDEVYYSHHRLLYFASHVFFFLESLIFLSCVQHKKFNWKSADQKKVEKLIYKFLKFSHSSFSFRILESPGEKLEDRGRMAKEDRGRMEKEDRGSTEKEDRVRTEKEDGGSKEKEDKWRTEKEIKGRLEKQAERLIKEDGRKQRREVERGVQIPETEELKITANHHRQSEKDGLEGREEKKESEKREEAKRKREKRKLRPNGNQVNLNQKMNSRDRVSPVRVSSNVFC